MYGSACVWSWEQGPLDCNIIRPYYRSFLYNHAKQILSLSLQFLELSIVPSSLAILCTILCCMEHRSILSIVPSSLAIVRRVETQNESLQPSEWRINKPFFLLKHSKFVIAWSFFTVELCCKDMMSLSSFDSSPYYYFYFGCKIRVILRRHTVIQAPYVARHETPILCFPQAWIDTDPLKGEEERAHHWQNLTYRKNMDVNGSGDLTLGAQANLVDVEVPPNS